VSYRASDGQTTRQLYKPWGEPRYASGSLPTDYTYTGQYSHVSDFGLLFYNARWYDPALGRFTQPDTVVPSGPQGYDRYAYTSNNPVRYVDPTGHFVETLWDIISVGMDIADIAQNGLNWGNGISLAVDVASVLIPGIPAVGAAIRAVNAVDNVVDATKAIDNVVDTVNAVDNAVDTANAVDNIGDALKAADDLPNPPPGGNAQWTNMGTNQSGATFWGPDRIVYTNNSDLLNAMNQHGPGIVLDGGHGTPTGQFIPKPEFFEGTFDFFKGSGIQVLDMNKLGTSDLMNLGEAGQNIYVNWCWGAYCTQILDAVTP
jgi:RHS repeat-associated protein